MSYEVTVSLTKVVEAENEQEAYQKASEEFMEDGINPKNFYVYVNGKEI